jgi:hypothetical protein
VRARYADPDRDVGLNRSGVQSHLIRPVDGNFKNDVFVPGPNSKESASYSAEAVAVPTVFHRRILRLEQRPDQLFTGRFADAASYGNHGRPERQAPRNECRSQENPALRSLN